MKELLQNTLVLPEGVRTHTIENSRGIFNLVESDPYVTSTSFPINYKDIGSFKEEDIYKRAYEFGWIAHKVPYGESPDYDFLFYPRAALLNCTIRVQIKSAGYKAQDDSYRVPITCTRNGNNKATYDKDKVDFIICWVPFVFYDYGFKQGAYIFPMEVLSSKDYKSDIHIYPHKEITSQARRSSKLGDFNVNEFFEAWDLLDEFAQSNGKISGIS